MSAKHSKKGPNQPARASAPLTEAVAHLSGAGVTAATATVANAPSWLDSAEPRKRRWGKMIFIGTWIYVGALGLLALDQTFRWGIFGPQVQPLP